MKEKIDTYEAHFAEWDAMGEDPSGVAFGINSDWYLTVNKGAVDDSSI